MSYLNNRRKGRNAPLLAVIASTAALAGCFHAAQVPEARTLIRAQEGIPADDLAAITTETLIERHRSELEKLADLTRKDDIERGGVILFANGITQLVEIHNDIRDGPDLINRYSLGEYELRQQIQDYLTCSVNARRNCNPAGTPQYISRENQFTNALNSIPHLPAKERAAQLDQVRIIYAELALHCTYLRNADEYERVKKRGKIIFHVHTHYDGVRRDAPPEEDPLRPSLQDLLISDNHEGIVSGVNLTGEHRLYHTHKGKYAILRSESALALR